MTVLATLQVAAAPQPCSSASFSDFDFWLGTWQVHSLDGTLQGTNSITKEEGGCLILEKWRSAQGGTGQSYNYYQSTTARWQQLWVSQGAIIDYAGGLTDKGAMQLQGNIHYQADDRSEKFKGTWTPQADGSVLQELREWNAESKQWQDWFTGVYTRTQ